MMTTYYLDENFMLHMEDGGGMTPWVDENGFFSDKGQAFIEGYRVVPEGMAWTRPDGKVFRGLMIAPGKDYTQLQIAQLKEEMADMKSALELLGVTDGE